jgi:hypothetical protein
MITVLVLVVFSLVLLTGEDSGRRSVSPTSKQ